MEKADQPLVIFDCDGVLVDSEPVSIRVLLDSFKRLGVTMSEEEAYERFLGRSLSLITDTLTNEFGLSVDPAFLDRMRGDLFERFSRELLPIGGIAQTLDRLPYARCVASSSQPERIRLSLSITGLLDRLDSHVFSATMVKRGKPAPDLFLYAAARMDADPHRCIVIEDSPAGIEAAKAAGMTVFAFTGGTHTRFPAYRQRIEALRPDVTFDVMPDLIHLIARHLAGGAEQPRAAFPA